MKTYYFLFLLYVFVAGCSTSKIEPIDINTVSIDINTVPIRIKYSGLKFSELKKDGQKLDYEYPGYDTVKKYADEINSKTSIQDNSPCIDILLSPKGHFRYAAYPNYEFLGPDLMVNIFCNSIKDFDKDELKTRIIKLLMPLSDKLGVKNAKLIFIY